MNCIIELAICKKPHDESMTAGRDTHHVRVLSATGYASEYVARYGNGDIAYSIPESVWTEIDKMLDASYPADVVELLTLWTIRIDEAITGETDNLDYDDSAGFIGIVKPDRLTEAI